MTDRPRYSATDADPDAGLPRVPVPDLTHTAQQFLDWCRPLLTEAQYADTALAVDDLLTTDGPAPTVQAAILADEANGVGDSWLDGFWRDRYLGRRDRIALNANFFFLFRDPPSPTGQADRAARLIHATLRYKDDLEHDRVAAPVVRGQRQSTVQNRYLFSVTRIPGLPIDTSRNPYSEAWPGPSQERHIVVCRAGRFVALDVLGTDGTPYPPRALATALQSVLDDDGAAPAEEQVGLLTTQARATWAADRQRLLGLDPANAATLDVLERALFLVCLDDTTPPDARTAGDLLLHGDGGGNRWYDKALSFIVFADGRAGLNGEHCNLDGATMIQLIDAVCPAAAAPFADDITTPVVPAARPVGFVLDEILRAGIRDAGEQFAAHAAQTVSRAVVLDDVGADAAKQHGMSPDALVQLSLQLTHHRVRGSVGATYESVATRQFRHGRTEAMRVVTPQIVAFVAAMDDPRTSAAARAAALRAAAHAHVERARACQAGDAPEQHLWELDLRRRRQEPATVPLRLYDSPGWRILRDDRLSTSSVPSDNVEVFGFGATAAGCIGVGYILLSRSLTVYLSTPRPAEAELTRFAATLPDTVRELLRVLDAVAERH